MVRSAQSMSCQTRASARIGARLERSLAGYVAAAGAAGVGLVALAQPAQAEIVYTPANIKLDFNTRVGVDINGDGTKDMYFNFYAVGKAFALSVSMPNGNAIRDAKGYVAQMFFGVPVGPKEQFEPGIGLLGYGFASSMASGSFGNWTNDNTRYLGVKLIIAGTVHYGWVRFNSEWTSLGPGVISGYAYETTPNTSIKTGHVSGPEKVGGTAAERLVPLPRQASLGMLARGADCISIWRREEEGSRLLG